MCSPCRGKARRERVWSLSSCTTARDGYAFRKPARDLITKKTFAKTIDIAAYQVLVLTFAEKTDRPQSSPACRVVARKGVPQPAEHLG